MLKLSLGARRTPRQKLSPLSGTVDFSGLAHFWVFKAKIGSVCTLFWKKNWQILIIFSTTFPAKIIGGLPLGRDRVMRPGSASILPIYSPEHGDDPRYPNLAKIPRKTVSGCLLRERSTGVFSIILEIP